LFELLLLSPDGEEDTFTWDAHEPSDVIRAEGLSPADRRRNEALFELWKVL
jgi:hypothetical protein